MRPDEKAAVGVTASAAMNGIMNGTMTGPVLRVSRLIGRLVTPLLVVGSAPAFAAGATAIEDLTRERIIPGATLIALATLALSLLLAFRNLRLSAPAAAAAAADLARVPEPLREVRLFRLSYALTLEAGRLVEGPRSARRRSVRTSSGRLIPWRSPEGTEEPGPEHPLSVLVAGERVVASLNHATGRVAVHEADLARLHGLGRRGRGLILFPLLLATLAFATVARGALGDFLQRNAAPSARDLWLSVVVAAALFAFAELMALALCIGATSAIFRRVRRAQLRRHYEPSLRAFLADLTKTPPRQPAPSSPPPPSPA